MDKGFIKNLGLLEEKVSGKDYLEVSSSSVGLFEKLSVAQGSNIIGLVGHFGVGKSTLIENVKSKRSTTENETWVHFDAWQFPERKELWDGLVLETARQLSKLEKYKGKVDGQSTKDIKFAVNTAGSAVKLATTAFGLSLILEPLFALVKNLDYFTERSPARRVFEIQDIFVDLINTIETNKVVFVVEDIDRSGQDGLFFLETFRQFLSKNKLEKQVLVIVAISENSYYQNLDTYFKCLDFVEFFNKKQNVKLGGFIEDVLVDSFEDKKYLSEFLEYIYEHYPDMNMRKIKLILRQSNLNYIEFARLGHQPNIVTCIAITASRYIKTNSSDNISYFDYFVKNQSVTLGNEFNRAILGTNLDFRGRYSGNFFIDHNGQLLTTRVITFTKREKPTDVTIKPSTPYYSTPYPDKEDKIYLPDFYFSNL